jgi:predicted transcriptional regulator
VIGNNENKGEIPFICPYCLQYVKSPIISEPWGFVVRCPNCYPTKMAVFNVKVEVEIKERYGILAKERTRQLQQEYCTFDGIGYSLKREHWNTALKNAYMEFWGSGEDGYAFLTACIPVEPTNRPKEIFWGSHYLALGNFKELKDVANPEKINQIYVVENQEEALFIKRAKLAEKKK